MDNLKNSKKINKRSKPIVLICILVLLLITGGTFAYLIAESEEKINSFSFIGTDPDGDHDMKAILVEPNWDQSTAYRLLPGDIRDKDPHIINTSTADIAEWIGMKLTFQRGDNGQPMTAEELDCVRAILIIDWNIGIGDNQWTRKDDKSDYDVTDIYYYNSIIDKGQQTAPIFTQIQIDPDATLDQIKMVSSMGGFHIFIEGAAVQVPGVNQSTARTEIDKLFM